MPDRKRASFSGKHEAKITAGLSTFPPIERWPEWVSLGAEVGAWESEWVCHLVKCLTLQQLLNPSSFGGAEEEELLGCYATGLLAHIRYLCC